MDLIAYSNHVVRERESIMLASYIVERTIFAQGMSGACVVIGPNAQRASVMARIADDVRTECSPFGKAVVECYEAEVPSWPSDARPPRSTVNALDLEAFMIALVPDLRDHADPIAVFEKHVAELRTREKNPGSVLLMVDDVQGVALRGYAPKLVQWLLEKSAEIPLVMGTTTDGWRVFSGYVEAIGLTKLLKRVYVVEVDLA